MLSFLPRTHLSIDVLFHSVSFLFTSKPSILILKMPQELRFFFLQTFPSSSLLPRFTRNPYDFPSLFLNCSFLLSKSFWKHFLWNTLHSSQNSLGRICFIDHHPAFPCFLRFRSCFFSVERNSCARLSLLSRLIADLYPSENMGAWDLQGKRKYSREMQLMQILKVCLVFFPSSPSFL